MAELKVGFHNGLATSLDELALPEGFCRRLEGWYYDPDDPTRIYKMPGRTLSGTLPSTTNVYGLGHAQFDAGNGNQIFALVNSSIYRGAAGTSISSWTQLKDQTSPTPLAFARAGAYLKCVHDGKNRWLLFTGASERPLIVDEDSNVRMAGLQKPLTAPTLTASSTVGTDVRPNAANNTNFAPNASAYDADETTASTASYSALQTGSKSTVWSFAAAAVPSGSTLYIKYATSSLPPSLSDGGREGGSESLVASLKIEVSEDNGSNYRTILEQNAPLTSSWCSTTLSTATNFSDVEVRCTLTKTSGESSVSALIYDIKSSVGRNTALTVGNYSYVTTECYRKALADGTEILIESAESDVATITISGTQYAVVVTLPSRSNLDTYGTPSTELFRRIYRTVTGGVWPNLGLIADNVSISAATYTDAFQVAEDTLGVPGVYMAYVGDAAYPAPGLPPALNDAVLFRGSIVGIPTHDPRRLIWSLPGEPEYFPAPHDFERIPDDRNDELKGIAAVGEYLLIFLRSRVVRVRDMPFAIAGASFDLDALNPDIVSPNEGLVGPEAYCYLQSQKGHPAIAWVSDSGIWMTDGSLLEERGLGCVKLTPYLDWKNTVDTTNLGSCHLTYDPIHQVVRFSYLSLSDGLRRELWLHTSPHHWVPSGQDQAVPKITGPHEIKAKAYAIGELISGATSTIKLWSLVASSGKIYNERTGTSDTAQFWDGTDINSIAEGGWIYPTGQDGDAHVHFATLLHSDWGAGQVCNVAVFGRQDESGIVARTEKKGVSLRGARGNRLLINRAGRAIKVRVQHTGEGTGSLASLVLEVDGVK